MSLARIVLWVVTLTAIAVTLRASFFDVVPGIYASVTLSLLVFVYLTGVLNPNWEMFGSVLDLGVGANSSNETRPVILCEFSDSIPSAAALTALTGLADRVGVKLALLWPHRKSGATISHGVDSPQQESERLALKAFCEAGNRLVLTIPLAQLALCLVSYQSCVRWLREEKARIVAQGGRAEYVLVPEHFAPSGCFAATRYVDLAVLVGSRGHNVDNTPRKPSQAVNLGTFPIAPSLNEIERSFEATTKAMRS